MAVIQQKRQPRKIGSKPRRKPIPVVICKTWTKWYLEYRSSGT